MVLGYRGDPSVGVAEYEGCPEGVPFKSTWGDGGHGGAALFLEVVSRRGTIVGALFRGRVFYGDLKQSSASSPTALLLQDQSEAPLKWALLPPAVVGARVAREAFRELHGSTTIRPFLREAGACVRSTAPAACFGRFVREEIYLPEAGIGNGVISRDQFAAALLTVSDGGGSMLIDHLTACFASGIPRALTGTSVDLITNDAWLCGFEAVGGVWQLTRFFQTDYGE